MIVSPFPLLQVFNGRVELANGVWQAVSAYDCEVTTFPVLVRIEELPDGIPIDRQTSVAKADTPPIAPEQVVSVGDA